MHLGVDISTYFDVINRNLTFKKNGGVIDVLKAFKDNNVDRVRIRVWVNPYDENGVSYAGGECTLDNFMKLAKLCISYGFKVMLDIHYSDFWCDPSKQCIPKEWVDLNNEELVTKVYDYTKTILNKIKDNRIDLESIQVGNEITNGMLWPKGKLNLIEEGKERENYEYFVRLFNSGSKACREVYPNAKVFLHLERSFDIPLYQEILSNFEKYHGDYDCLGVSYYPYWHGSMDELFANIEASKKYCKEIYIVETGFGFTADSYKKMIEGNEVTKVLVDEEFLKTMSYKIPYEMSKEGQKDFISDLIKKAKEHGVLGIYYWEPCWLPNGEIEWASKEGQQYIRENKNTLNEWANQCLFDYDGEMNVGFDVFSLKEE